MQPWLPAREERPLQEVQVQMRPASTMKLRAAAAAAKAEAVAENIGDRPWAGRAAAMRSRSLPPVTIALSRGPLGKGAAVNASEDDVIREDSDGEIDWGSGTEEPLPEPQPLQGSDAQPRRSPVPRRSLSRRRVRRSAPGAGRQWRHRSKSRRASAPCRQLPGAEQVQEALEPSLADAVSTGPDVCDLPAPPASSSWDWPLTRLEKKARVLMIDRQVVMMDREALVRQLTRLSGASAARSHRS